MQHSEAHSATHGAGPGAIHAHAHITLCPEQEMHVRIGNVCLHLCRRDFCHLARAVMDALATMSAAERRSIIGDVH